eukprot:288240-Pyramimonas_sp.AAC.1
MIQWRNGSMAQWINGSMAHWLHGLIAPCLNGSMAQWLHASMAQWFIWFNGTDAAAVVAAVHPRCTRLLIDVMNRNPQIKLHQEVNPKQVTDVTGCDWM